MAESVHWCGRVLRGDHVLRRRWICGLVQGRRGKPGRTFGMRVEERAGL